MKRCPISILGLSLSKAGSRCRVVDICQRRSGSGVCVLFLFHTTRQWLVMVEFSLARSRWKEPSVPHVHVWEIYWLPHTHTQNANGSFRSAAALGSRGRHTGCICGECINFKMRTNFFSFFFPRNVLKLFWGQKPTTTRQVTRKSPSDSGGKEMKSLPAICLSVCHPPGRLPWKMLFHQKAAVDAALSTAATLLCVPCWSCNQSWSHCFCKGTTDSGTWG